MKTSTIKSSYFFKIIFSIVLFACITLYSNALLAQGPPPPPGGGGTGTNNGGNQTGGNAPIGGGTLLLMGLASMYAGKKVFSLEANEKPEE